MKKHVHLLNNDFTIDYEIKLSNLDIQKGYFALLEDELFVIIKYLKELKRI